MKVTITRANGGTYVLRDIVLPDGISETTAITIDHASGQMVIHGNRHGGATIDYWPFHNLRDETRPVKVEIEL